MKRLYSLAAILLGAAAFLFSFALLTHAEQAKKTTESQSGPKIVFQEKEHDFDKVGPDETVKHTFKFSNTGNKPLVIEDIRATCGCTGTLLSQKELLPGEEGSLEVTYHTGKSGGPKRKAIMVKTNDPENASVKLEVLSNVIVPVEVRPQSLYWVTDRNEKSVRTVSLLYSQELELNIQALDMSSPAFAASYKPTTEKDVSGYHIDVRYDGTLPAGNFSEKLTISTDNPKYPKFDVVIRGKVAGPVKVVPDRIALGLVKEDQLPERTIRIYNTNNKDFEITEIKTSNPILVVELHQEDSPSKYELKVKLTQEPPPGAFSERVSIKTNDPSEPVIEVPVHAYVK